MSDITATRDLAVIAIIAYAAYKLKAPYQKAADAVSGAVETVTERFYFYGAGGELKAAADQAAVGQTDTEVTTDYTDYWNKYFQSKFGDTAPKVEEPPTAADAATGQGMQETVQILPHEPAQYTPELTPAIEEMIFAPAPDRPPVQIFPPADIPTARTTPIHRELAPIVPPIVPPVTALIRPTPTPTSRPSYDTQPLDSMTPTEAAAAGYDYSGAVGWFKEN